MTSDERTVYTITDNTSLISVSEAGLIEVLQKGITSTATIEVTCFQKVHEIHSHR